MADFVHGGTSPAVLVVSVVPQGKGDQVAQSAKAIQAAGGFIMYGQGTASKEIWERLGITKYREIVFFSTLYNKADEVITAISQHCEKKKVNNGITFVVPVDRFLGKVLAEKLMKKAMRLEGLTAEMPPEKVDEIKQKVENMMVEFSEEKKSAQDSCDSELVVVKMANGYGQEVMNCARKAGAKGGTILHGRMPDASEVKFFNITIEPEGDILFMLVNKEITDKILENISLQFGPLTPAHAFGFVVPVLKTMPIGGGEK